MNAPYLNISNTGFNFVLNQGFKANNITIIKIDMVIVNIVK